MASRWRFRWLVPGLSEYDAELQILPRTLGDEGFTAALTDGTGLSLEAAVAEVRASLCASGRLDVTRTA